ATLPPRLKKAIATLSPLNRHGLRAPVIYPRKSYRHGIATRSPRLSGSGSLSIVSFFPRKHQTLRIAYKSCLRGF
ncbi:MAG: hypothetical protein P4L69_03345, partial [Desulfosporosinus sp.]|nr:hypothetical protein [Desulfosporosinus sp.]